MKLPSALQFIMNTAQDLQRECMITGNIAVVFEGRIVYVSLPMVRMLKSPEDN